MAITRRGFMASGAAAAAAMGSFNTAKADDAPKQAKLRMSSQINRIPGKSEEEKLARMAEWGFEGVELRRDFGDKVDFYNEQVKKNGLEVSAICYGSVRGDLVSADESKRGPAKEELKTALKNAGAVGSTGVIYVPCFNREQNLPNKEIRAILLDTLPELGEVAVENNTRILLEPLNRKEAYFLRQVADGASICRDCGPGVCVMGDFYHMCIEEPNDMGAFISARDYLHHIHLASRTRKLPGQDDRSFVDGFKGLKMIGYNDFCSYECGCIGDPMVEVPKANAFLKSQWDEAVI